MTTLVINDLAASKELDSKTMAGVYGGTIADANAIVGDVFGRGLNFLLGSPVTANDPDDNAIGIATATDQYGYSDRGVVNNVDLDFIVASITS